MSFNYYANARFYDNRADHVRYKSENNYKEIGGGDHNYDVDRKKHYINIYPFALTIGCATIPPFGST